MGTTDAKIYIAFCTAPDRTVAESLARALVDASAAACVNIFDNVTSIYRWKGAVHADNEVQLVIKTTHQKLTSVEEILRKTHPYDVPELIAWPVERGLPEYLAWVIDETK